MTPRSKKKETGFPKSLDPFAHHGVIFSDEMSGEHYVGECPLCGKKKFYVNPDSQMWTCHSGECQVSGNLLTFFDRVHSMYREGMTPALWRELSKSRSTPVKFLKRWKIGHDGRQYWYPYFTRNGHVCNLRGYTLGGHFFSTRGVPVTLFGVEQLADRPLKWPIYLCEGEHDAIALDWFLRSHRKKGVVLAVPGAGVFKDLWPEFFRGRRVYLCYDNDAAGRKGNDKATALLSPVVQALSHLDWREGTPDGFDVRDFVVLRSEQNTDTAWVDFRALFTKKHLPKTEEKKLEPIDWETLLSKFQDELEMNPEMEASLKLMLGVVYANRIGRYPQIWMFMVGPAGCGKTTLVNTLSRIENIQEISSFTKNTLVSGYKGEGDNDPSLLPRLNGKMVVVKDYTEILSMHPQDMQEIAAQLRGAYDGYYNKGYGNNQFRTYVDIRFGMIACVTPAIYGNSTASLGERFLRWTVMDTESVDPINTIVRALMNVAGNKATHADLAPYVARFFAREVDYDNAVQPTALDTLRIACMGRMVALLRSEVQKDNREQVLYRPTTEIGTRPGEQLFRLGQGLCIVNDKKEFDREIMQMLLKTAYDSSTGYNLDIVRALYAASEEGISYLGASEIAIRASMPTAKAMECLKDLTEFRVLNAQRVPVDDGTRREKTMYALSEMMRRVWECAHGMRMYTPASNGQVKSAIWKPPTETFRQFRIGSSGGSRG